MTGKTLPPTLAFQQALRSARATYCCYDHGESLRLLVGLPLSTAHPEKLSSPIDLSAVAQELSRSLEYLLAPVAARVAFSERPLPCAQLTQEPADARLTAICDALLTNQAMEQVPAKIAVDRAWVWRAGVEVEQGSRGALESLFFQVSAGTGKLQEHLTQRAAALVEEAGGGFVTAYPVTAYWNSLSLARITSARQVLRDLKKNHPKLIVQRKGADVVVLAKGMELARLSFPEETNKDISPLFAAFGGL